MCLMLCSWCWRSGVFGFGARCVFSSWNGICGRDAAGKLEGYEGLESYSLGRSGRINIAIHKARYVGPWLHSWSSWQLMTLSSLQSLSILLQKLDAVSICFLTINMKRWTELDWHGEITVLLESDNQQGCALEIGFGSVVVWNSDCIASQTDTLIWGWRLLINYDCVEFEVAKLVNSLVG